MRVSHFKLGIIIVIFQIQLGLSEGNYVVHPEEGTLQQLTSSSAFSESTSENNSLKKKNYLAPSKRVSAKSFLEASEAPTTSRYTNKNYHLPSSGQHVFGSTSSGSYSESDSMHGHSTSMVASQGHSAVIGQGGTSSALSFSESHGSETHSMAHTDSSSIVRNGFNHENNPQTMHYEVTTPSEAHAGQSGFFHSIHSNEKTQLSSEAHSSSMVVENQSGDHSLNQAASFSHSSVFTDEHPSSTTHHLISPSLATAQNDHQNQQNVATSSFSTSSESNPGLSGYLLPKFSGTKTRTTSASHASSVVEQQQTETHTLAATSATSHSSTNINEHSGSSNVMTHGSSEAYSSGGHLMSHAETSASSQTNVNRESHSLVHGNEAIGSPEASEVHSSHGRFFLPKHSEEAQTAAHTSAHSEGHAGSLQATSVASSDAYSTGGHSMSHSETLTASQSNTNHENYPMVHGNGATGSSEGFSGHIGFYPPNHSDDKTKHVETQTAAHTSAHSEEHVGSLQATSVASSDAYSYGGHSMSHAESSAISQINANHESHPIVHGIGVTSSAEASGNSGFFIPHYSGDKTHHVETQTAAHSSAHSEGHATGATSFASSESHSSGGHHETIVNTQSPAHHAIFSGTRVTSVPENTHHYQEMSPEIVEMQPQGHHSLLSGTRVTSIGEHELENTEISDFTSLFDFNLVRPEIEPYVENNVVKPERHHLVEIFAEKFLPEIHPVEIEPIPEERHHLYEIFVEKHIPESHHIEIEPIPEERHHLYDIFAEKPTHEPHYIEINPIPEEKHHLHEIFAEKRISEPHHLFETEPIPLISEDKHHLFEHFFNREKIFSIDYIDEEPHLIFSHNGAHLPIVDLLEIINKFIPVHSQQNSAEHLLVPEIPIHKQKYFGPLNHFSVFDLLSHVHDHSERIIPFEDIFSEITSRLHHRGLDDHISLVSDVLASDFFEKMSLDHIFVNHHENYLPFMDSIFGYYHMGAVLMHHGHQTIAEHQTAVHTPKIRALFDLYHVLTEKIFEFTERIIEEGLELHGECKYELLRDYLLDKRNGWFDLMQHSLDFMRRNSFLVKIMIRNENAVGFENYFSHLLSKNTELMERSLAIFERSYPVVLRHGFDQASLGHSIYLSRTTTSIYSFYKFMNNYMATINFAARKISLAPQIVDHLFRSCMDLIKRMIHLTGGNYNNYNVESNFGIESVGSELIIFMKQTMVEVVRSVEHVLMFAESIIHSSVGLTETTVVSLHENRLDHLLEISNTFMDTYLTYLSTVMNNPIFISYFKDFTQFDSVNYFDAVLMDSHKILDRLLYFMEISYEKASGNKEHVHMIIPNIHATNALLKNYVYIVDRATHTITISESDIFRHFSECKTLADRMNSLIEYVVTGKQIALISLAGMESEEIERKMVEFRSYYLHNPWTHLFHDHHIKLNENTADFVQHLMHYKNGERAYSVLLEEQGRLYRHNLHSDNRLGLKREIVEHLNKHFLHEEIDFKELEYDEDYHLSFCLPITKHYFNEFLMIENKNIVL